jgi:hypothetical protein
MNNKEVVEKLRVVCNIGSDHIDQYIKSKENEIEIWFCAKWLRYLFTCVKSFPIFKRLKYVYVCDGKTRGQCFVHNTYDYTCNNLKIEKVIFPCLIGIRDFVTGKELFTEVHDEIRYVDNARIAYFLDQNAQKLHSAKLLFMCIRRVYPMIDKNVVKRIATIYIYQEYTVLSKREEDLRTRVWTEKRIKLENDELLQKQEETIQKKNALSSELKELDEKMKNVRKELQLVIADSVTIGKLLESNQKKREFIKNE